MIQCNILRPDISTLCIGQAASMGSFFAGTKGKRFLPNSRIMVHQPSAGFQGQATVIIHANEVLSLKERLNDLFETHWKKCWRNKSALERDNFMTADVAQS